MESSRAHLSSPSSLPSHSHSLAPQRGEGRGEGSATDHLISNVLESLTGVQSQWLGDVRPFFQELLAKAQDQKLSDADFIATLEAAQKRIPELFHSMNHQAIATAFYNSMSAALVNGASQKYMSLESRRRRMASLK